jgi:hypothetical protein
MIKTLTPKMVVGELHPDDIFPKVIRNRTKPSAGLDEDEAKEEHVKGKLRDFPLSMNSPGII